MSEKKSPFVLGALFVALILIAVGIAYVVSPLMAQHPEEEAVTETQAPETTAEEIAEPETAEPVSIDVQKALAPRILGNPSAPIKISEHSSFTCGHCGNFHKNTFAQFKQAYIATDKAYLVFSDFPLNAPALHASMVARCLPQTERFFEFVDLLYAKQNEWAYTGSYKNYLKGYAADFGLSGAGVEACIANEEIQKGILQGMQAAQTQWQIGSTPSFVVNNKTVISGALPFEKFSEELDKAVAGPQGE